MKVMTYSIPKEEAKEKYLSILQSKSDTPLDMARKKAYYAMSKGHPILDIYTVMEQAGYNELRQPRIAICRADAERCYFRPESDWENGKSVTNGAASFSGEETAWRMTKNEPVRFQRGTFAALVGQSVNTLTTSVPKIPFEHKPKGALHNYYLLWEVDHWRIEPSRDPLLLRRLSANIFEVLAEWELSGLEWSILRGL